MSQDNRPLYIVAKLISGKSTFSKEEILIIITSIGQKELPEGLFDMVKDFADNHEPR